MGFLLSFFLQWVPYGNGQVTLFGLSHWNRFFVIWRMRALKNNSQGSNTEAIYINETSFDPPLLSPLRYIQFYWTYLGALRVFLYYYFAIGYQRLMWLAFNCAKLKKSSVHYCHCKTFHWFASYCAFDPWIRSIYLDIFNFRFLFKWYFIISSVPEGNIPPEVCSSFRFYVNGKSKAIAGKHCLEAGNTVTGGCSSLMQVDRKDIQ